MPRVEPSTMPNAASPARIAPSRLLVVVVCYKVVDLTIECLRALEPEIADLPGAHVAVCENGSGPDAERRLREAIEREGWCAWCTLTSLYPNRGFTGGNNAVIRAALASAAPPDYVLLLNADTVVLPGALRTLVTFLDAHPEAGIAGSQLLSPDGVVQASPFRFQGIASEFDRGLRLGIVSRLLSRWAVVPPTPAGAFLADWVSGASMMIRREVFEQVGLLDEGLYTYFDDIDLCLRARRAGWPTWYVPPSRVIHLEGASTGIHSRAASVPQPRPAYWFQARRRFFLKNYGPLYTACADAAFIVGFTLWRLRRWLQRKPDRDPPGMLKDAIRNSLFWTGWKLRVVDNPAFSALGNSVPAAAPASPDKPVA